LHRIHEIDSSLQKFSKDIGQIKAHNCGTKRKEMVLFAKLTFRIRVDIEKAITDTNIEGFCKRSFINFMTY